MNQLTEELFNDSESPRKGKKTQLTVRLSHSQISTVKKLSEETGISQAAAVRRIIDKGIKQGDL